MSDKSFSSRLMENMRQLKLLLWKKYLIQKRSKIGTLMELVVPTLFVIILLPIRTIVKSNYYTNDTTYTEFEFNKLPFNLRPIPTVIGRQSLEWTFAYQPNSSDLANRIMSKVGSNLGMNIVCKT